MKTALIRRALLPVLAASAVMTAAPALAQDVGFSISFGSPGYRQDYGHDPYGYDRDYRYDRGYGYDRDYGYDLRVRAARLAQRIDRGAYNGRISRSEARRLSWEMQQYRSLEWRYARDGLSRAEYAALSYRLDRIQTRLRHERRDRW